MIDLFARNYDFNDRVKRNITHVEKDFNPFSDLVADTDYKIVAEKAILRTRRHMNRGADLEDFYYTAAIAYPFETEPYMQSRFSVGS